MRIVQITAEFAPFAKAGGLGEVLVGLSRELTRQGAQVEVILPNYDFMPFKSLKREMDFTSFEWGHPIQNTMWSTTAEECRLHLLETHHPKHLFSRGAIYGFADDTPRFLYFARALLDYFKQKGEVIDILHLHDWHAAALCPLLREVFKEVPVKAIVLSIHNLEYQGQCSFHDLAAIGLKKEEMIHLQTGSHYNLLKGAIHYADALVAVSPTYAKEILTHEYGCGLERELEKNKGKLTGILNGLDSMLWDPKTDPALKAHYSARDPVDKIMESKRENRKKIPLEGDLIWFGAITRLVPQKGPKLIEAALKEALRQQCGFALIGAAHSPDILRHFEDLKKSYANNPQVFIHLGHDEALAHLLYAALDFFVVPSLFEPCGLTQLIAMRYGTVPIVRATGGLKDTVFDGSNGYTFSSPTVEAVVETVDRAIRHYREKGALIKRGMESDFSWRLPAKEYLKLYHKLSSAFLM